MAMGKRDTEQQQDLFITHDRLPRSPGHVFYRKLNRLLAEGGFDGWIEALCEPHYCRGQGRPSIPPGVYFRMRLVGYFEGINSQRGIAWRCSDSLSLRAARGLMPEYLETCVPDGSNLGRGLTPTHTLVTSGTEIGGRPILLAFQHNNRFTRKVQRAPSPCRGAKLACHCCGP
jgi:hypothetical protein